MNLSAEWCATLQANGWEADHWSNVGDPCAQDSEIMAFAAQNDQIVVTHDLDFGMLLATTKAHAPSVVLIRIQDVLLESLAPFLLGCLSQFRTQLLQGALIVIDEDRARVRILPFR